MRFLLISGCHLQQETYTHIILTRTLSDKTIRQFVTFSVAYK